MATLTASRIGCPGAILPYQQERDAGRRYIVIVTTHVSMGLLLRPLPCRRYGSLLSSFVHQAALTRPFSTSRPLTAPPMRGYRDALNLLESLQSNRTVVSEVSRSAKDMNALAIPEMIEWSRRAGYEVGDLARGRTKYIHVAGTKGKGSTCLMIQNILLQYRRQQDTEGGGQGVGKIGLFSSPHLVSVRERILIDGIPLSESLFAKYFFEIWDRLFQPATDVTPPQDTSLGYFRYLTLMAFHAFASEGVENGIIECGIGGEYDSTNILPAEAVSTTAITTLGIDHVAMLGETLPEIAWHKAGIMKRGVPAFTVEQEQDALEVLTQRASENKVEMKLVPRIKAFQDDKLRLGLDGEFQKDNASLAVAVASSHLQSLGFKDESLGDLKQDDLPTKFVQALESTSLPGRWQTLKQGNLTWFIDGAHTPESIQATADWFWGKVFHDFSEQGRPTATMLIFNQQERDAGALLTNLMARLEQNSQPHLNIQSNRLRTNTRQLRYFTYAVFCRNEPFKAGDDEVRDIEKQENLERLYRRLEGNPLTIAYGSVEEAVEMARRVSADEGDNVFVLVTGSLHLVGGLLAVLGKNT